jgi:hypothetical protein
MMFTGEHKAGAQTFLSLHAHGELLILPNVWNPIGAAPNASLRQSSSKWLGEIWFRVTFGQYFEALADTRCINKQRSQQ